MKYLIQVKSFNQPIIFNTVVECEANFRKAAVVYRMSTVLQVCLRMATGM